MGANESPVNAYFVIGSRLYMKSGNNRYKKVSVIEPLKTQGSIDLKA